MDRGGAIYAVAFPSERRVHFNIVRGSPLRNWQNNDSALGRAESSRIKKEFQDDE